jgi:hypothetical protein
MPEAMNRFVKVSYVPFVGWLFPMAVRDNGPYALDHARQAFVLALFVLGALMGLFLMMLFIPSAFHVVRLILVMAIYGVYGFYFFLCGLGTYYVRKGKFVAFPLVRDVTARLGF